MMSSNKGASASMKKEQRQKAAEAKLTSNQAARRARHTPPPEQRRDQGMIPFLSFTLSASTKEEKDAAWFSLRLSKIVPDYWRKYRYPENIQQAVMRGSLYFDGPIPMELAKKIERELAPHWKKGKKDG